jgi:hypothetical protein
MGRNARLRKLKRQARRQLGAASATGGLASAFSEKHPEAIVLCDGAAEKMSEVIEDFAEPLLSRADSPDDVTKALQIAMAAWNYSLLDEAAKAEPDCPYSFLFADPNMRSVFEFLLERKRRLYPENTRAILDFQLVPNGTEFQFNVVSTFG